MVSLIAYSLFSSVTLSISIFFFFFNDTATTEIYTLSLHDALPILGKPGALQSLRIRRAPALDPGAARPRQRLRAAVARSTPRLQPIERHRPAPRTHRGALPRRLTRSGARHDRQLRSELRQLLAIARARRHGRRDDAELPADLGAGAELRRTGQGVSAPREGGVGAVHRGDSHRDRAGHQARRRHQPA